MAAMNKLWKLWKKKKLTLKKKVRLFKAYILPILLYSCGTWSLTKTDGSALNSFHRRLLRRVVGIFWPDKKKSEELYKRTEALELSQTIAYHRHTLLGHILRLNIEALTQKTMNNYYMSTPKTLPGRLKTTLSAELKKDPEARNLSLNSHEDLLKLRKMAKNKFEWKRLYSLNS